MIEGEPGLTGERYDDLWWKLVRSQSEEVSKILKRLNGQLVVDFGSGKKTRDFELLLKHLGVIEYNAVDQDPPESTSVISGDIFAGDMLETAKKLKPSGGYSIAMNGINEELIAAESDYGQKLAREVVRLLHPQGLLFGIANMGILEKIRQQPEMNGAFISIEGSPDGIENRYYLISKKL